MSEMKKRSSFKRRHKMAKRNAILAIIIAIVAIIIVGIAMFFFKHNGSKPSTIPSEKSANVSIEMEKIDKSWLKKAIKSAESIEEKNCTEISYKEMYENLKVAKKVRRKLFPEQDELNEAFVNLVQSIEKLKPINS